MEISSIFYWTSGEAFLFIHAFCYCILAEKGFQNEIFEKIFVGSLVDG